MRPMLCLGPVKLTCTDCCGQSKYADRVFPKLSAEDVEEGGGGLVPKGSVAKFADTKFIAFISLLEAMMNRSVTFASVSTPTISHHPTRSALAAHVS
jgi:hypothetical protein